MTRETSVSAAAKPDDDEYLLLRGGRLFDGTGDDLVTDGAVLVEGQRIAAAGPEGDLDVPDDATVVDVGDRTLMPGIVDAHTHLTIFNSRVRGRFRLSDPKNSLPYNTIRAMESVASYIDKGVTTQREVGGRDFISASVRDAIEEGRIPGPRLLPSGPILTPTAGLDDKRPYFVEGNLANGWEVNGRQEVVKAVREQKKAGVSTIKVDASGAWTAFSDSKTPTMSEEEMAAAVEEAHKFGLRVAAHAQATEGIKNAARAGVDTIEHATYLDEEGLELILDNDIIVVPTLIPFEEFLDAGEGVEMNESQRQALKDDRAAQRESFVMAHENGVQLAVGSDAIPPMVPHGDTHREIRHFHRLGFSKSDALVAATKSSAEAVGLGDEIGTLEPDKSADIIAVEGIRSTISTSWPIPRTLPSSSKRVRS
ncbi:amidohydrolase family protein [Haloarculaceae archaeon H-GB2-1]|nr:amidohydrolase family protein [Haloarculaceae archaeon H-GB2-1]